MPQKLLQLKNEIVELITERTLPPVSPETPNRLPECLKDFQLGNGAFHLSDTNRSDRPYVYFSKWEDNSCVEKYCGRWSGTMSDAEPLKKYNTQFRELLSKEVGNIKAKALAGA